MNNVNVTNLLHQNKSCFKSIRTPKSETTCEAAKQNYVQQVIFILTHEFQRRFVFPHPTLSPFLTLLLPLFKHICPLLFVSFYLYHPTASPPPYTTLPFPSSYPYSSSSFCSWYTASSSLHTSSFFYSFVLRTAGFWHKWVSGWSGASHCRTEMCHLLPPGSRSPQQLNFGGNGCWASTSCVLY